MTANQINYARHLEEKRHNVETESQGRRDVISRAVTAEANRSQAITAASRQREDARHNSATEQQNWFAQLETQRANQEREAINWWTSRATAAESARHNQATESLSRQQLSETHRSNVANETAKRIANQISSRTNEVNLWRYQQENARELAKLPILQQNADSQYISAIASRRQAEVAGVRAATESNALAESIRSNLAREAETNRHNYASESLSGYQASEAARHNAIVEANERYANYVRNQELEPKRQQAAAATTRAKASETQAKAAAATAAARVFSTAAGIAGTILGG